MRVLGIDPGETMSGFVLIGRSHGKKVSDDKSFELLDCGCISNEEVMTMVEFDNPEIVIEGFLSYGRAIGNTTISSIIWAGRFDFRQSAIWITTRDVYNLFCGRKAAPESVVKKAIIEYFGGESAMYGVPCPFCSGRGRVGGRRDRRSCPDCGGSGEASRGLAPGLKRIPGGGGKHAWSSFAVVVTAIETGLLK